MQVDFSRLLHSDYLFARKEIMRMAYTFTNSKGTKYYLHAKKVQRASGKETELFYFARDIREGQEVKEVPAGKKVVELASGLPVLKKI